MAEDKQHGTEQATARRKAEARKKGQIPISREIPFAATLLAAVALLYGLTNAGMAAMIEMMRGWLGFATGQGAAASFETGQLQQVWARIGRDMSVLMLPVTGTLMLVGAGAYVAQTGFLWRDEAFRLDVSRLNPLEGLKRLLSLRSLAEAIKAALKVSLIGYVGWAAVRHEIAGLPSLAHMDVHGILGHTGWLAFKMSVWIAGAVAVIAAADYAYQRFEWERNLRMTKQEIKQEHRETEGDPLLRSRIRSIQRERARNRMIAAVPKADVVITNPDHLAVALRYDPAAMAAPIVVAKGAGYLAQRIKEVAAEHGVMIIEHKPVARALYRLVEVGREIPADLYRAVAEILAMVYRAKGRVFSR
jgi:flagellar biosynthetic protein FlhB